MNKIQEDIFKGIKKNWDYWTITGFVLIAFIILFVSGVWTPQMVHIDGIDPICYFSYIHSIFFDKDLNFDNEYKALNAKLMGKVRRTPKGYPSNSFSIGPGLILSPVYLLTHLVILTGKKYLNWDVEPDGFSTPYQFVTIAMLAFFGWIGLLLTHSFLKIFFPIHQSLAATLIIFLTTNLIYYFFPQTFMPHSLSFFSISLFIFHFSKHIEDIKVFKIKQWIISGMLLGLATLVRWQDFLFIILPILTLSSIVSKKQIFEKQNLKSVFFSLGGFLVACLVVFLPQMIAWKVINGSLLTIPQGAGFLHLTRPALLKVLFSTFNGLFSWHPITLVAIIGIFFQLKKNKILSTAFLLIFLGEYYINASVLDWHGSWGFGMRRFINCCPIFAFGLAALLNKLESPKLRFSFLIGGISIFIIWNMLFLTQFYLGLIPKYRPLNFHEFVTQKFIILKAINRKRFTTAAKELIARRNLKDAERAIDLALQLEPQSVDTCSTAGNYFMVKGDFNSAIHFYQKTLELEERGEWLYGLAVAYYYLDNLTEAKSNLLKVIKRNKEMVKESQQFLKLLSGIQE